MSSENTYRTRCLYESAFLIACQQKLTCLEKENKFFWFLFADKTVCEKLAREYWSGEAVVSAKLYADTIKGLKDRLFAEMRIRNDS